MLLFLHGEDTYQSREKLKEIVGQYQKIHKSGLNLKVFDFEKTDFNDFRDQLRQAAMFKEKKLFILKNAFLKESFKERFLREKDFFLKSDEIIIFFEEKKIPASDRLARFLAKNGKSQEFNLLSGVALRKWLANQFQNCSAKFEDGVLERLIMSAGNDLWLLSNEVKKLAYYRRGEIIREKDVVLLVKPRLEAEIFKTIDALAERERARCLNLIEKHLAKGDSPLYLLSMIAFEFRNLLLAKTNSRFKKGTSPFVIKKSILLAKKFSLEELREIYQKIFRTDLEIKRGRLKPEEGIRFLVTEI